MSEVTRVFQMSEFADHRDKLCISDHHSVLQTNNFKFLCFSIVVIIYQSISRNCDITSGVSGSSFRSVLETVMFILFTFNQGSNCEKMNWEGQQHSRNQGAGGLRGHNGMNKGTGEVKPPNLPSIRTLHSMLNMAHFD